MIYILLDEEPQEFVTLKGEVFKYLVKVRRHSISDKLQFRVKDKMETLYTYEIVSIDNRTLSLKYLGSVKRVVHPGKELHIAWCLIDTKSIEKVLPSLSEIGVDKISFISCDRTQKNFKPDLKRFQRILEASMQQCGRSTYIEFASYKNIEAFIAEYPETKVFDFTEKTLDDFSEIQTVLIGCEGGFSSREKELLATLDIFRLDTPMVLRSESAVVAVSSKILL